MSFFSKLTAKSAGDTISAPEARDRMAQGGGFVLLDVRTPDEYKQVRIKGAKLLPVDQIPARAATDLPDKDAPILVYCHSGARAGSAVRMLRKMGYSNAVSFGGIASWPYETVRG